MIDFDYLSQLSESDKDFLDKFSKEYYSADFRHDKPLINGKKARRKIYKTNNSRNQDITAYLGNFKAMESYNDITDDDLKSKSPEDALIQMIDIKRKSTSKP